MLDILPHWRSPYEKVTNTVTPKQEPFSLENNTDEKPLYRRNPFLLTALILLTLLLLPLASLITYRISPSSRPTPPVPTPTPTPLPHPSSPTATKVSHPEPHHPCGTSTAQALSNNCTFDQLMWAWYPPHCPHYANPAFLATALADGAPWRFYLDPHKQVPAEGENWRRVLDNEVDGVYGERREHLSHCVYMFLGVGMVLKEREEGREGRVTGRAIDFEHLEHCAGVLMEGLRNGGETERGWWDVQTKAPRVFYDQDC